MVEDTRWRLSYFSSSLVSGGERVAIFGSLGEAAVARSRVEAVVFFG